MTMKNVSTAMCGIICAIAFSLICTAIVALFAPAMLGDGQFGMIFMLTCPIGWIAGCVAASSRGTAEQNANIGCGALALGAFAFLFLGPIIMLLLLSPIGMLQQWLGK